MAHAVAPEVERMNRVHANALENVPVMLIVGLVYVLAGASTTCVTVLMGGVTACRLLHSVFYVFALQPARTIAFLLALGATFAMVVHTLVLIF